jgi:predicted GH43/DUF377 family glycosyl hydrolase
MTSQVSLRTGRDVIHRYTGNPLIAIEDLAFRCSDIWNAGVVRFRDEYLLLLTVETLEGLGSIYLARGRDGYHFSVESIAYVADSETGKRVGLARTEDFQSVERMNFVSEPDTKSGALFARKIGGRYAMLQRPSAGGSIWISYSDDLMYWGSSTVVITPRCGYWDSTRVGAAGPPIEIDQGWMLIYYGEKDTTAGPLVRLGAVVLDRDDPSRVIARSNIPILAPREKYERIGDVGNVVFSCGALLEGNGEVKVYYGASDSCICLGVGLLDDIVRVCHESRKEY